MPGIKGWRIFANDTSGNLNNTAFDTFQLWGWANVTNETPVNESVPQGSAVTLVCWVRDKDNSSSITGYNVSFWRDDSTFLGSNLTNGSGRAEFIWDTSSSTLGTYYPSCRLENSNSTLFYNASEQNAANATITIIDATPPGWYTPGANRSTVHKNESISFYANWTDNAGLKWASLELRNATGAWSNVSINDTIFGMQNWSNFTWTPSASEYPGVWQWRIWANDTSGNLNNTTSDAFEVWGWANLTNETPVNNSAIRGSNVTLTCRVRDKDNGTGIQDYNVSFYNNTDSGITFLGSNLTDSTGYTTIEWNTSNIELGVYYPLCNITDHAPIYYNVSEFNSDNTTVTVRAATNVSQVAVNNSNPTQGQQIRITAYLVYDNNTLLQNQPIAFYRNATAIGSNYTNETGWATYDWDTSTTPVGDYFINATYNGNASLYTLASFNNSVLMTVAPSGQAILVVSVAKYINVTRNSSGYEFNTSVENVGSVSATNVWLNWTLPSNWTNVTGNLSNFTGTLQPNNISWSNITLQVNISAELGPQNISARANSTTSNDTENVTVYVFATTNVSNVSVNNTSPLGGGIVLIRVNLTYDNSSPAVNQNVSFYYNDTFIDYNDTDETGWTSIEWNTTNASAATYYINATYGGNYSVWTLSSFNNTTTVTVIDAPPQWFAPQINVSSPMPAGSVVLHSTNWTDDVMLSGYIFSWNGTGANCDEWSNDTFVPSGATKQNWSNVTKVINLSCAGRTVGWKIYANDTAGNWNSTPDQTYEINPAPSIISFAPLDTNPKNVETDSRTFNITVSQTVNVSWQINGSEVQPNTTVTEALYMNSSAEVGTWNITAVAMNINGTAQQTWVWIVYPKANLTLGNITNIISDWGRPFYVNHSVNVSVNETIDTTYMNYNVSQFNNTSWAQPLFGTVWNNYTRTGNVTGNSTIYVEVNSSSANNDSEMFWINITPRDANATMLSNDTQMFYIWESFWVNASAVDEYAENFTGSASLVENGAVLETVSNVTKYANFSLNKSAFGTWNYSVLFHNASYYYNSTTNNTTVIISKYFVTNLEYHLLRIDIPTYIDIVLSGNINFGTALPSTANKPTVDEKPLNVTVTENTNVHTNITLKGTDLNYSGNSIPVNSITYTNSTGVQNTTLSHNYNPTPTYTDWVDMPTGTDAGNYNRSVYFWITIPSGQAAGTLYQGNVTILAKESGT
jgi:5-hydroxyisourate hydrolase-like protein (transthyretin family)